MEIGAYASFFMTFSNTVFSELSDYVFIRERLNGSQTFTPWTATRRSLRRTVVAAAQSYSMSEVRVLANGRR